MDERKTSANSSLLDYVSYDSMNRSVRALTCWFGSSLVAIATFLVINKASQAQLPPSEQSIPQPGAVSICQPPQPNEFLLLIATPTADKQSQVQQLLPPNASVSTCGYLNDVVTRVGGFRTVERANAWAKYINESTGFGAYVVRPAETPVAATSSPTPSPSTLQPPSTQSNKTAATSNSTYRPKALGPGYAVLVDYFNQPELAAKVRQILGQEIGLVSYRQAPFLLALYTNDSNAAYRALQSLSDSGLWATIVDSRRVVLLRQAVILPQAASRQ